MLYVYQKPKTFQTVGLVSVFFAALGHNISALNWGYQANEAKLDDMINFMLLLVSGFPWDQQCPQYIKKQSNK